MFQYVCRKDSSACCLNHSEVSSVTRVVAGLCKYCVILRTVMTIIIFHDLLFTVILKFGPRARIPVGLRKDSTTFSTVMIIIIFPRLLLNSRLFRPSFANPNNPPAFSYTLSYFFSSFKDRRRQKPKNNGLRSCSSFIKSSNVYQSFRKLSKPSRYVNRRVAIQLL